MVKYDRAMKLPLRMEEINRIDDDTYGSIDLIDDNDLYVTKVLAENDEELRTPENILDTRKDAIFILNAVNNFDDMIKLIMNYQELLINLNNDSKDLEKIKNLINSFKTIDYENGIPYTWDDIIK